MHIDLEDIMKNHKSKDKPLEMILTHPDSESKTTEFKNKNSTIMFRVEEIEQTNTVVHLKFKLKGFRERKIYFKLFRSRSMGEYVPFYTS